MLGKEDINHQKVKNSVQLEYKRRLRFILKTNLSGRHKISAINTYTVPLIRYTAGIINWTNKKLHSLDTKTRKVITVHRGLHPRADIERIYLPRSMGGRGSRTLKDTVREEELSFKDYVIKHEILRAILKDTLKDSEETKKEYQQRREIDRIESYRNKPLRGQYTRMSNRQTIDEESTWLWLKKRDIKIETEGLLTAAQDQALPTNYLRSKYDSNTSSLCSLCKEKTETVNHLIAGWKVLAGKEYKDQTTSQEQSLGTCHRKHQI